MFISGASGELRAACALAKGGGTAQAAQFVPVSCGHCQGVMGSVWLRSQCSAWNPREWWPLGA